MLSKIINITLGIISAASPLAACDDARTEEGDPTETSSNQQYKDELDEATVSDHPTTGHTGHKLLFHEEK